MTDGSPGNAVAVIGAACRFPGAADLDAFRRLLASGTDAVTVPSDADLLAAGVSADDLADPDYVRAVLRPPDLDRFDAAFFGLSDVDADRCDPQLRLLVTAARTAIEHAGYDVTALAAGTGVFAAARPGRYRGLHLLADGFETSADARAEPAAASFVAGRLGLRGPAVTVSSCSLLAVLQAAQAIQAGTCDVAVAGGVHVELPDGHGYRWTPGGGRPPDGRTRPFEAAAAGAVPGSGVGVVVLKRLTDAVSDGDRILAVVAAGASGHGDAAPVVAEALAVAGWSPAELSTVEAHGAASPAGDAAEVAALTDAFALAGGVPPAGSVALASVRSVVGDLGPAGGIAGLLATVLGPHHGSGPGTPGVGPPNPALRESPFRLGRTGGARRSLVHAVDGGTSTALAVEDGLPPLLAGTPARDRVVVWSAVDDGAVDATGAALARFFAGCPEPVFADAVATLQRGRTAHPVRRAAVCADAADATTRVRSPIVPTGTAAGAVLHFPDGPPPALPTLYGVEPTLTVHADVALDALERLGLDPGHPGLRRFVAQYALGMLWRTWLAGPVAVTGTGAGPVAGAAVTGDLDLDEAVRYVDAMYVEAMYQVPGQPVPPAVDPAPGTVVVDGDPAWRDLMDTLARLWVAGVEVDWAAVEPDHALQRVVVPGHPLRPRRHWVVPDRGPAAPRDARSSVSAPSPEVSTVDWLPAPAGPLRPLGRTEHAFWVLEQLAPESGVSNIGIAFRTARPLRWYPLQTAVAHLVRRHPALRLRFPAVDGVPVRHLTAQEDATVTVATRTTTPERLVADLQEFQHTPFDLDRDLLFRAGHFTLPDGSSVVALAAHHIVVDAPSIQLLVEDLGVAYDGIAATGRVPDAIAGEEPHLGEPEPDPESVRYWLGHLRGADPAAMVLPGSRPAPDRPTFAGHTCSWPMTADAREALAGLRQRLRVTDNVVLMAAFCLTLQRHGAGPDLVFGVPVGTRRPATARHVGYGVSTLPLRVRVDPDAGFADLVRLVGDTFLAGVEHADATVERVLTERGHGTGDWRVPLFRHMFNYRPWSDEGIRICGEVPDYIEDLFDRSRIDLQVVAVPEPDRFTLRCWHSTEVQGEADVAAFVARMQALLVRAAADPSRPVADLPLASADDAAVLARVNATDRAWRSPATVVERVFAVDPARTAVDDSDRLTTYGGLTARAAAVRDLLRAHGVSPGDVVALGLRRSADLAAAVLGVWAAGAVYLPLSADQPSTRLAFQVREAGATLVLAESAPWAGIPAVPMSAVPVSTVDGAAPDLVVDPDSAAYVIFTSGSTGQPKAVEVSHRNLANLVFDFADRLPAGSARAVLWSTAFTFDISALELLLPLATGGTLVVAPDDALLKPRALLDLVRAADVSLVQATPTAWRIVAPEATDELAGRVLLCGGEPLPAALAARLRALGGTLHNVYGPTETTIWSTAARLDTDPADPVPVGVPLANTRVFVTDPAGRHLPPGLPGELCIAGDGVSAGYPRRPDLTADRFGVDPRYGRFYRTGDVATLGHDGVLVLAGRTDRQVKLRGHRIELDEVEAVLHTHPDVALAAVTLVGDPQVDGRLVAHVQPRPGATTPGASTPGAPTTSLRDALWAHARETLPAAAVPAGITVVDRLPTTPNGKVDRQALVHVADDPVPVAAPSTVDGELVATLTGLWRDALRRPDVGPHDNFFLHGGHSILAARLAGRIEEVTGHPVGVRAVFTHPTPSQLAAALA
ncbi:non-ribosomal peptide synthetase [Virgisporangium aurantiacum]|uniref:Amino acid adenylation domain-containing protein n=1 Tax=Virgisporangium aurantiacum TaxID=175570 RepID=A0A8J4DZW0_9ACTN|nr:non-ribosomal peptide synthetase [Virgisporangium aurantiacum]GIJ56364.1 hypothetical protein Vau01_038800 [Virgisporangium aurantiacum]